MKISLCKLEEKLNNQLKAACIACAITAISLASIAQDFQGFVAKTKKVLTSDFLDPNAAQFRNVFVSKFEKDLILCGEVNQKNAFGAYVGFRPFVAWGNSKHIKDGSADSLFDAFYTQCDKTLYKVK